MGYVGPAVIDRLRESYPAARLIGLDAGFFAHCLTDAELLPECELDSQHFVDVRAVDQGMLEGVDAVVHLAAVSNDPIGNAYESVTHEINHGGTVHLARLAKAAGARSFAFASSCSVYGLSEADVTTESDPVRPLTPYAKTKWLAEQDLQDLADETFTVTSLRFATACGMSRRLRLDLVLNDFVASAVVSNRIVILSDGTPWRPLIHVRDMARALEWAVERDSRESGAFLALNVGSDSWNYRIRELAEEVGARMPGVRVEVNPEGAPDKRSYRVGFELFRRLAPAHQPTVDLSTTIDELRNGLGAMRFHDPDFRSSHLVRLAVLERLREAGHLTDSLLWTHRNGRRAAA